MSVRTVWGPSIDAKQYGRITTPSAYTGERCRILSYCQRIVRDTKRELENHFRWRLNRLDFFFLTSSVPNAVVLRSADRHGIGMCVGLPFAIVRHLRRAMSNPEFLETYLVGGERVDWIWNFLGMMIEHAYLHEVAHAVRGHFGYQRARRPRSSLDEQSQTLSRYLELDADLQALDMWLAVTEEQGDFPKSEELLFELYFQRIFTLLMIYQVLDVGNATIKRQQTQRHPPPIHRALMLEEAIDQTLPERYGLPRAMVPNVRHQAFWEASVAAKSARLVEDRWWGGSTGRRRGIRSYRGLVRHFLEDVEPRLNAYVASLPDSLV